MTENYSLKNFIDNDLKVFSNLDNVRSIPSIIDGLKDAQRKAVHGLLSHGSDKIKVAQIGSYACLITHYNHGEGSMSDTIIGLAQNFAGSNNVNLFEPIGQFGSILGAEAASPRYIYTKPSIYLKQYILPDDAKILEHREEEGTQLEPLYYLPTLPMWIVNGAIGIGTGHSTKILSRNPKNVVAVMQKMLTNSITEEEALKQLHPYFNGWTGIVKRGESDTQWELTGKLEVVNTTTIKITELPVTYGVDKFKKILIDLIDKGKIKDYDNNSNEERFEFVVSVPREIGRKSVKELLVLFKLTTKFGENITLFDTTGKLKRYDNVYQALQEFLQFKLTKVQVRKDANIAVVDEEINWLVNKSKFIEHWNKSTNIVSKLSKTDLISHFCTVVESKYIDRLLRMPVYSLTNDQIGEMKKEIAALQEDRTRLVNTTPVQLYQADIAKL